MRAGEILNTARFKNKNTQYWYIETKIAVCNKNEIGSRSTPVDFGVILKDSIIV